MMSTSILPVRAPLDHQAAPPTTWTSGLRSTTPRSHAGGAQVRPTFLGINRLRRHQPGPHTVDRLNHVHAAEVGAARQVELQHPGTPTAIIAAETTTETEETSSRRLVDQALLGISGVLMAALVWMIAGKDDLSSPFLILSSWLWHALETTAIAGIAYSMWLLVRRISWTIRIVTAGIVLLTWLLTICLG